MEMFKNLEPEIFDCGLQMNTVFVLFEISQSALTADLFPKKDTDLPETG